MKFCYTLGFRDQDIDGRKVIGREAVRALIIQDGKILMVGSNKGDFKFPGGGIEDGEEHEEALQREVEEETGFIVSKIKRKLGEITERRIDKYEAGSVFQMSSYYYLCQLSEEEGRQHLDVYEKALDFCPHWLAIDEAIVANEQSMVKWGERANPWADRETVVLKELKKIIDFQ